MRIESKAMNVAGWIVVAAAMLLSIPGVRIARADEASDPSQAETAAQGPSCDVPVAKQVQLLDSQLQMEIARLTQNEPDAQRSFDPELAGDEPIPLNNRGYNYRATPAPR